MKGFTMKGQDHVNELKWGCGKPTWRQDWEGERERTFC